MSVGFCFWEPSLSPHKLDLFKSLVSGAPERSCTYVAQQGLRAERAVQGWTVGDLTAFDVRIGPTQSQIDEIVDSSPAQTIHLFSGIHWVPCVVGGLRAVMRRSRPFAIMAEPRASEGFKGAMRLAHSWLTERAVRRRASFVLAIGRHGPRWFTAAGYRPEIVFPFAYFLPVPAAVPETTDRPRLQVGYVGRLTREKGIGLFLSAARELPLDCSIVIAGAGPEAPRVVALAEAAPNVTFLGTLSMQEVARLLAKTDILVVPSLTTDDGWAAVVSEALLAGATVIASERAGASICLDDRRRGAVLRSLSKEGLVAALRSGLASFDLTDEARLARAEWARRHLSGYAGAAYLRLIASHVLDGAPKPPPFFI